MTPFNTIYVDKFVLSRISFIIYKYQIVNTIAVHLFLNLLKNYTDQT